MEEEINKRLRALEKMLGVKGKEYDAGLLEGIAALEDVRDYVSTKKEEKTWK